jgi:hypothetical protein
MDQQKSQGMRKIPNHSMNPSLNSLNYLTMSKFYLPELELTMIPTLQSSRKLKACLGFKLRHAAWFIC